MDCKSGMSPNDVRSILEGYCLESEYVSTFTATFEQDSDVAILADLPTSKILRFARIEGEALNAEKVTRIVDVDGKNLVLDSVAVRSGTFPINVIQYKQLSDEWIVNTRDCQVIPVVERMTGVSFDGKKRVQEFHSGTGSTVLILNNRPIVEVHAINLITNPENWVYVSPSSVQPIAEEGLLKLKAVLESWQNYVPAFPRGTNNIRVDYTYGLDEVPCDVTRAVAMLTASQALAMMGARGGGGSLGVQGFNKNYGDRGKYTDYRNELERWADSLLRGYVMGVMGQ